MSHVISISDETYRTLASLASERGQTAEAYLEAWVAQQAREQEQTQRNIERDPHQEPRYETFEAFFAGLGMSEDEIEQAKRAADTNDAHRQRHGAGATME